MSVDGIICQLLAHRGIEQLEQFRNPDFERDTHDPLLLPDMGTASKLLAKAVREKWGVAVFGDYDADGIPATALMVRGLHGIGLEVQGIIPKRSEGYGLSAGTVQRVIATGAKLLVTVDNGTASAQEIAELTAAGIRTIICDHHEPGAHAVAKADAVINPKLASSTYPFRELCGAAIAWKMLHATYAELGLPTAPLKWELDLVALATVADMVPLIGENRVLTSFGLKVLAKSRNGGLQALAGAAGITLANVTAQDIGFGLAPRLNAASRTHQEEEDGENIPLRLLVSSKEGSRQADAAHLDRCNAERQELVRLQLAQADTQVKSQLDNPCLVAYSPEWSSGVIGLIAGRLSETYSRPTVVLADEGGKTKGSVRSIGNVDTVEWLESVSALLERYGGHAKAGGLTLALSGKAAVDELRLQLKAHFDERNITPAILMLQCQRQPDIELEPEELTEGLAEALEGLAPFGTGFGLPLIGGTMTVLQSSTVGKQKEHLSLLFSGDPPLKGIAFGMGGRNIPVGSLVKTLFELTRQEWQGRRTLNATVRRIDLL